MQSNSSIDEMEVVLKEIQKSFELLVNKKEENKTSEESFEVNKEKGFEEQMKSGEEKLQQVEEKLKEKKGNIEKGEQIIKNMKDLIDKMNLFIVAEKTEGKKLKSQYNETIDKIKIIEENNLQNLIAPLQKQVAILQSDLKTKKEEWDSKKNSFEIFSEQDIIQKNPFQLGTQKLQYSSALGNQINQKSQLQTDIWGRLIEEKINSPQKTQQGAETIGTLGNSILNITNTSETQKKVGVKKQSKVQTGSPCTQNGTVQPKDSTNTNTIQQLQIDTLPSPENIFKEVPSFPFNANLF